MNGIPDRVGRYEVERLLGQGAMGSVYLGRDPELDRAVAIKTVKHLDLEERKLRTFLERFKNEARAAARLSHPAIVAVYDVGEAEGVGPYLVFEYVAGSTLKQILKSRGPLPAKDTVRMGRQIAAALDTAHAAGVIHRDIKPDNILVNPAGDAKLADFGVARVPNAALTREGQFLGTPCYAAPETLSEGLYGPHSDLFSFAVVLYEMVSATRAFPGDDAIKVAHNVVNDDPKPPSEAAPSARVAKEVDAVLMRALEKDPDARYTSASELIETLCQAFVAAGVLEEDATGAQLLQSLERPAKSGGASWAFLAVLAGGLAIGVGLVAAFGGWGDSDAPPDAGLGLAGALDAGVASVRPSVESDAGAPTGPADAGAPRSAGEDAGIASMSRDARDERAKQFMDAARAHLAAGNLEAAAGELRQARMYDTDPDGNNDLLALEEELRRRRGP